MATSRVRHRGQPPRDVDHGPSSGRGRSGTPGVHAQVAAIAQAEASRLVMVGGRMPDGGAGKVERTMASEAQREAWRAAERVPSPIARVAVARPALGSREHLQQSRMRGGERNRQLVAAASAGRLADPPIASPEEPVMPEHIAAPEPEPASPRPEPLVVTLAVHVDAARAAQEAWEAFDAADTARIHTEEAWLAARAALEASWLALWHQGDWMAPAELGPDDPDPDVAGSPAADPPADVPPPNDEAGTIEEPATDAAARMAAFASGRAAAAPEAGGGSGNDRLSAHQRTVLAEVTRLGGDRKAAAETLHTSIANVEIALERIGKAGLLPIALIPLLPARFAKYSGV